MIKKASILLLTLALLISIIPNALAAEAAAPESEQHTQPGQVIAIIPVDEDAAPPPPAASSGNVIFLPPQSDTQPGQVIAAIPQNLTPGTGAGAGTGVGLPVVAGRGFTPSTRIPYANLRAQIVQHRQVNPDVVGWLRIPNTNINSPIVQTTRANGNEWYNTRNWQRVNFPGRTWRNFAYTSTFLDVRNRTGTTWASGSRNTVLYGHNWTNLHRPYDIGTNNNHVMFGQLPSFTSVNFARANPHIYYSNINNEGIWRVFAVATVEVHPNFNYNNPNPSPEQLGRIISEWQARSVLNFGVDVNSSDRILTLSTCTREIGAFGEHQRFVVVARLLRPGESENDAVTVSVNPNPRQQGRPFALQ